MLSRVSRLNNENAPLDYPMHKRTYYPFVNLSQLTTLVYAFN
jgi:hypothetical protein